MTQIFCKMNQLNNAMLFKSDYLFNNGTKNMLLISGVWVELGLRLRCSRHVLVSRGLYSSGFWPFRRKEYFTAFPKISLININNFRITQKTIACNFVCKILFVNHGESNKHSKLWKSSLLFGPDGSFFSDLHLFLAHFIASLHRSVSV